MTVKEAVAVVKYKDSVPKHTMPCMPCAALFRAPSVKEGGAVGRREKSDSEAERRRLRGPWDHSGMIGVKVDVERLVKMPGVVVVRSK